MTAELVAEPVVGYRLWGVVPPFTRLTPWGFKMARTMDSWVGGSAVAQCWSFRSAKRHASGELAPGDECACGLHAWKTFDLLHESYPRSCWLPAPPPAPPPLYLSRGVGAPFAIKGAVVAWGRIHEHELGFRAEHMKVIALLGEDGVLMIDRMAAELDVPVLDASDLEGYAEWWGSALPVTPVEDVA